MNDEFLPPPSCIHLDFYPLFQWTIILSYRALFKVCVYDTYFEFICPYIMQYSTIHTYLVYLSMCIDQSQTLVIKQRKVLQ